MNKKEKSPLDGLYVATPCSVGFENMEGDERVRFCNMCQQNVYNIAEMTKKEAEDLIREKEGNLCVRLYLRPDGTVITDNCPVGLRELRKQWLKIAAAIALIIPCLAFLQSVGAQGLVGAPTGGGRYGQSNEVGTLADYGYDQARDMSRLATALSSVPALFFGLRKIIRALKQPLLVRSLKIKAVATGVALIIGIPLLVHLVGTFLINNVGGLGGGL